jgi:hypothetical protein
MELKVRALELVESHELYEVLGEQENARLEASGICASGISAPVVKFANHWWMRCVSVGAGVI